MAETAMLLIGALMLTGGGLGAVTDDPDVYLGVRWFCVALAFLGSLMLAVAIWKVAHA